MQIIGSNASRAAAALLALALLSSPSWAAPDPVTAPALLTEAPTPDAMGHFLAAKNLIGATPKENVFVDKVRDKASDMVLTAMNFLGVPYRRGGTSAERGFDCSGFTRQVFETSLGHVLPRRVDEQAKAPGMLAIKRDALQPGDLVFFNTLRRTFSHVGIYLGDGKFIHAPKPGGEVRVEDMRFTYWAKRFTGARRAEPAREQAALDPATIAPAAAQAPQPILR